MKTKTLEEKLRQIVANHQYQKIDGVIVDVVTANAILTVIDNVNETNKAKFLAINDVTKMATLAWKVLK